MFDTTKIYISAYGHLASEKTKTASKKAVKHTKEFASDHSSELKTAATTAFVVGLAARVAGFKAGYAFATNKTPLT
jgi:hypothetical protein